MKTILLTVCLTLLFSVSAFAMTKETREVKCWDFEEFQKQIYTPLNLKGVSETITEAYENGSPKKIITVLVGINQSDEPYATFVVDTSFIPKYMDNDEYKMKTCILVIIPH